MNKKTVLVTGGAGYIGSHTVKKLRKNYKIIVVDDLSTGDKDSVEGTELVMADFSNKDILKSVIKKNKPSVVIHFAASKDAAESVSRPDKYFYNNTAKTITFLNTLVEEGVNKIIFSSTAAVYGDVSAFPITEKFPVCPTNPYGESKAMIESVLLDYQKTLGLKPIILRYFNAGGADPEGTLGNNYPDPEDVISVIMDVALGKRKEFCIFGVDYETRDGSCIRDIIHVDDLAEAHVLALDKLIDDELTGTYNLGSEKGYSVREIVSAAKKITGVKFKVVEAARRDGDIVISIASSDLAKKELGWKPQHGIKDIISDAWIWQKKRSVK